MDDEVSYCEECEREMPSDLDGGMCWDCQEREVEEHERDIEESGLNDPLY